MVSRLTSGPGTPEGKALLTESALAEGRTVENQYPSMPQKKLDLNPIPAMTELVAKSAFPKGNVYMTMRDQLGVWYEDSDFASLFSPQYGRPPLSPGQLAMITIMQFAEGLTDRQAAEAVRSRIDWKYALGLELTDGGFNFSVLSEFRDRLIAADAISKLFDLMLNHFQSRKLIKPRGRARTDSTHVVAAIRQLNRLECVGETLRRALNDLATLAPEWLLSKVNPDWFERYGRRFEQYRLPKEKKEQENLALSIGLDGEELLSAVYGEVASEWLAQLESVAILRQVWLQQYYWQERHLSWRSPQDLPPFGLLIQSPYDPDARNRTKRTTNWTGYAVHLTETCDQDTPNLITHIETTKATTPDGAMTPKIHLALADKELLPQEHFVDAGYVNAQLLVSSKTDYDIELVSRIPPDSSWQAQVQDGFDISRFTVDWDAQQVICPAGVVSQSWRSRWDSDGNQAFEVSFPKSDCLNCSQRPHCTRKATGPRSVKFKPQALHLALVEARASQRNDSWHLRYAIRAGIEGTISLATHKLRLRRCRYIGWVKTKLQHQLTAAALNLTRVVAWLQGIPLAKTRRSPFATLAPETP